VTLREKTCGETLIPLAIDHSKLIETITLPITIVDQHYSRIRVIGNVSDSITEPRKKIHLLL